MMPFHSLANTINIPTASAPALFPSPSGGPSPHLPGNIGSRTIYIGDLSIYCTESDVSQLFASYGPIESIHLRRATSQLAFGFVRFKHRPSAENALMSMQGIVFMGRPLRLGWAEDTRNLNHPQSGASSARSGSMTTHSSPNLFPALTTAAISSSLPPSLGSPSLSTSSHAQIHVTFLSNHLKIVTESFLRTIFEHFGEVVDVSIKKLHVSKETGQQSGYGFVHYPLNELGLAAAMQAVNAMNERTIESIFFRCSMSHGLMKYMKERPVPDNRGGYNSIGNSHVFNPAEVKNNNVLSSQRSLYPGYSPVFSSNFHSEVDSFSVKEHLLHQPKTALEASTRRSFTHSSVNPPDGLFIASSAISPMNEPSLALSMNTPVTSHAQRGSFNSMNSSMASTISVPRGSFSSSSAYEVSNGSLLFPESVFTSLENLRFHNP